MPVYSRVLWVVLCWMLCTVAAFQPALAQDGAILDSTVVALSEEDLVQLAGRAPDMREIARQVEVRAITYLSDGLKVKGYIAAPRSGEKLPVVIWNRGGSGDFGAINDLRATLFLGRIASWGYVVVATNYRGNGGGEGKDEFGGKDANDVMNLFPLLAGLPRADVSRVGMVGWSRGGLMTCLAMTRTDQLKAAVIGAGLFDSHRMIKDRLEMETEVMAKFVPSYATEKTAALDARSPLLWAERLHPKTPLLILQGAADSKVNPREAMDMASRLLDLRHPFRFVLFEGAEHAIREHEDEVNRLTRQWLDHFVRDLKPWASPG